MVGLEGLLVISGNCRRDSVKNIKQHARLDETLAIRAWHNMSISIKHGGAGRLIRWIRSLAAPDSDFGVEPTNHLYGIEVDRKTTTLKIHERQYKKITTFQSFRQARFISPYGLISLYQNKQKLMTILQSAASAIFMLPLLLVFLVFIAAC